MQNNVAWGVEFGGSAVRLVRVTRAGAGYRADRYLEATLNDRWAAAPDVAAAVARLAAENITEPLGVSVPDELVLFRTLSLPDADPETVAKMVDGQVEALIPTQAEQFVTGHCGGADPHRTGRHRVLVCAARREGLAGPMAGCRRLGRNADVLGPSILALAAMWARLLEHSGRAVLLVDVGARCTSLAAVDSGGVAHCCVIYQGGDHWTERIAEELQITCQQAEARKLTYAEAPDARDASPGASDHSSATQADPTVHACMQQALGDWARQLKEAYAHCVRGIPRQRRPDRCVLFGRSARMPTLHALAGESLGMKVSQADPPPQLALDGGADFDRWAVAIGAALSAMDGDWPAVNLTARSEDRSRRRQRFSWRWAALICWLVAGVFGLYALDRLEAGRLGTRLRNVQTKIRSRGDLARQLAIGRYLETAVPMPLEVLDRISQAVPKKALLSAWHYSRNGDVTVGGTVPSEKEFLKMLGALSEVGEVEWKSGRPDKGKFRFDIHLQVGRPRKSAAKPPAGPATGPASGPASGRVGETRPARTQQGGES